MPLLRTELYLLLPTPHRDSQSFSMGETTSPKLPLHVGDLDPHLIHGSLGPSKSVPNSI